jgi:hypothetical protein
MYQAQCLWHVVCDWGVNIVPQYSNTLIISKFLVSTAHWNDTRDNMLFIDRGIHNKWVSQRGTKQNKIKSSYEGLCYAKLAGNKSKYTAFW